MHRRPGLFGLSRFFVSRWVGHASLASALVVACTGQIGDGGTGVWPGAPSTPGGRSSSGDGGPAGGNTEGGTGSSGGGADAAPAVPFEPFSVASSVTKVKSVLTGLAPTQAEVDSVRASASNLSGLVTTWMGTPQYTAKMEGFFADAFQQSQVAAVSFSQIDDGNVTPFDELLLNFRQGFAKTVTELIAEGQPFTQTVTTTRYMMTTAMMTYYAYADASVVTDATAKGGGNNQCRPYDNDKSWGFQLTAQNVSLADSGNPASPNYLKFSVPNLVHQYDVGSAGEQDVPSQYPSCANVDPVVVNGQTAFAGGDAMCGWLWDALIGNNFRFSYAQANGQICYGGSVFQDLPSHPRVFIDSDYTDWRMVTINQATSASEQTRFWDLVGNRGSSTLTLIEPRVGYFTTPAFLAQYPTNISNQARATINQTMIVGLGHPFNGRDPITVKNAPGIDPTHAANPACFSCHWSLEPMARYFRSNLTLSYSTQEDPTQTAVTGTFLFDNVVANSGTTLSYLANQIIAHPEFPVAWTVKLCSWANSSPCDPSDPEVLRVAKVFASSNFDWGTMVHELFTSPLVTYASPTLSVENTGAAVPIARRAQLCATLDSRLGLTDVCGFNFIPLQFGGGGATSTLPSPGRCDCNYQGVVCPDNACPCTKCADPGPVPPAAAGLPVDGYSRGAADPLFVNDPNPFWRSSIEQICAYVADLVVDAGATPLYSSSSPAAVTTSIASIVHGLMGLDSSRDTQPIAILTSHYTSATGAGHSPTDSLKSTFTVACSSPAVSAVGE